jgi:hypothetical protein
MFTCTLHPKHANRQTQCTLHFETLHPYTHNTPTHVRFFCLSIYLSIYLSISILVLDMMEEESTTPFSLFFAVRVQFSKLLACYARSTPPFSPPPLSRSATDVAAATESALWGNYAVCVGSAPGTVRLSSFAFSGVFWLFCCFLHWS